MCHPVGHGIVGVYSWMHAFFMLMLSRPGDWIHPTCLEVPVNHIALLDHIKDLYDLYVYIAST